MALAGKMPEVKITMTKDFGKILAAMHNTKISGSPNFISAIQIAQVCLPSLPCNNGSWLSNTDRINYKNNTSSHL
jgi:hypothetical protein